LELLGDPQSELFRCPPGSDREVVEAFPEVEIAQDPVGILRLRLGDEPSRQPQSVGRSAQTRPDFDGESGQHLSRRLLVLASRLVENADDVGERPADTDRRKLIRIADQDEPLNVAEVECSEHRVEIVHRQHRALVDQRLGSGPPKPTLASSRDDRDRRRLVARATSATAWNGA